MEQHRPWNREVRTIDLFLPFIPWLKKYTSELAKKDFIAGVTVAAVLTPQAMAFAMLAGLPPIIGFYAALFGAVIASLWGSSPKLSTGPVAIVSMLVFGALAPLAEPGSADYITLAAALAVLSGAILLLMGVFRLGFLARIIPHSVIIGFATSAAIIIAFIQLPPLFGFIAERHEFILPTIRNIVFGLGNLHGTTVLIGCLSVAALFLLKRLSPHLPGALIVLVCVTTASYLLNFEALGVALVGSVPSILPSLGVPALAFSGWLALLSKAWIIALVGFVESYAVARAVGASERERIDVNQELVGQGLANIFAGFFRGYPVSGSFSRTAVNAAAGAQTGMASVFAALGVLLALMFIAPVFTYIPLAVLAAIVIVSVVDLIDFSKVRSLYRMSHTDGIIALTTFSVALILKPDDAVAIGVIIALVLFVRRIVSARVRVLGVESEWGILQGIGTSGNIETFEGVLILRIETVAFYGNIDNIISTIDQIIIEQESSRQEIQAVVFDCSSINYIDLSSAETLRHYFESLAEQRIKVYAIYMHRGVSERLRLVGAEPYFTTLHNIKEMRAALAIPEPSGEAEKVVESENAVTQ